MDSQLSDIHFFMKHYTSSDVLNSLLVKNSENVNLTLQVTTLLSLLIILFEGLFNNFRQLLILSRNYSII